MFCLKVIGITGTFCAGAGTAASLLGELLGAPVASYSDKLAEILDSRGLQRTRLNRFNLANELRGKDPAYLSKLIAKYFKKTKGNAFFVAEKLRSMGDYNGLKNEFGKDLVLLSIDAPLKLRYSRSISRSREGEGKLSFEQFAQSERKENNELASEGEMNISGLMALADCTIVNEGTEKELRSKLEKFARQFGLAK